MKTADSRAEITRPQFDSEAEDGPDRQPWGQIVQSSVLQVQRPKPPLIERTLEVWQPRASKVLTLEDARQIVENVTGFFTILKEWKANEQLTINKIKRAEPDADRDSIARLIE